MWLPNIFARLALFGALLAGVPIPAQTQNANVTDHQGMYAAALRSGLNEMSRAWGRLDLTDRGNRMPINFHDIVVQKDSSITNGLDAQLDGHRITYMDDRALINRWKHLRKEFPILVMRPIDRTGGDTEISVHLCWVSYGKGKLLIALDSWANVHFRYDSATRKYIVANVELGGV
jgi:hypothetical protein